MILETRQSLGLSKILTLARKWAWLVLLVVGIAVAATVIYSLTLPPVYRSEATLLVGQDQNLTNSNGTPVTTNLAAAYVLLATQPPILQATAQAIGWTESWQSLYYHVTASADGQLVTVAGTGADPATAQTITNEVAHQITLQDPAKGPQNRSDETLAFVARQQEVLKNQIETSQKTLNDLNAQVAAEHDPAKIKDLNSTISTIQGQVDNWQKTYAQLLTATTTGPQHFISVVAPAPLPASPWSPNIPLNALLAVLGGLLIAGTGIVLLEYLDDTIHDRDDARRELNLGTLGVISRIRNIQRPEDALIVLKQPRAPIAEAYRILRTNLRFSGLENTGGLLLVTSANPGEGKTTTSANLAIALAQAGKRVVLVDVDLRRPSLYKFFGVSNDVGLSQLFLEDGASSETVALSTPVPGLRLVPSGPLPPNPSEMLESKRMEEVLQQFRAHADIVILDSPPVLAVADAGILGSYCSGAVLVIDAEKTRSDIARRAVETLRGTNTKILGVILNKLNEKRGEGYSSYYENS